jgi:hypothetical protein
MSIPPLRLLPQSNQATAPACGQVGTTVCPASGVGRATGRPRVRDTGSRRGPATRIRGTGPRREERRGPRADPQQAGQSLVLPGASV